ncbi:aminoglycoside phosphotransferase family protein [Dactylosporangium sp. NPDC051541]|uniref:aminoglycoside phosphotransferase family protein n=1 Tax=Dactylosporangium sp. NPDC051541 TaxID=3363977 RepID=UPI0037A400DE
MFDTNIVPAALRAMPRWWREGTGWLDELPRLAGEQCRRWGLEPDGAVAHGSNALVIMVTRGGERLALRLAPPSAEAEVVAQCAALRFWGGRGTVRLVDADPGRGAMLLERLSAGRSLLDEPVRVAVVELGRMMRRLAVPAPADVPTTADRVRDLEPEWRRLGAPFPADVLSVALNVVPDLRQRGRTSASLVDVDATPMSAVNADLHSAQVLRGRRDGREEWLAVDPVLLRGDIEYDLARVLWTRLDEMADDEVIGHFDAAVAAAEVDPRRAWDWVVYRAVDYWLWGLGRGLTEDPQRCHRLITIMRSRRHR